MDYQQIFQEIGEKVSGISSQVLDVVSNKIGIETATFQVKLLTIIFLLLLFLVVLKFAHSTTKIILAILITIIIISTFFTMI